MISWALIAEAEPARLQALAAEAWEDVTSGGEPPPMRATVLAGGRAAVHGDEAGLSGLVEEWTGAVARRLQRPVTGLDLDPDLDERYEAKPKGSVSTRRGALAHAQKIGLLAVPAPITNRSLCLVEGASPADVAAAICAGLRIPALPPKFTISPHPLGALISADPPDLGPVTIGRHCVQLGPVWGFIWGAETKKLLVEWKVDGSSGYLWLPELDGEPGPLAARVAELTPAAIEAAFGVRDPGG
jgi:hypothetical protein